MEEMKIELKTELVTLAKAKGLDIAEDAAGKLVEVAFDVVEMVIAKSENTYDDMIFAAVKGKAKEMVKELVDKIDGQVG